MCFQVCRAGFVFQKFRKWVAASDKGLTMWCHSVLHGSDECSDNENKFECNLKLSIGAGLELVPYFLTT